MSDLWCKKCSGFILHSKCYCQPFKVKRLERGYENEEPEVVHAMDAERAAEKWAEEYDRDSGDYRILSGVDFSLAVESSDGSTAVYDIDAESVPTYHARERKAQSSAASESPK